MSIIFSPSDLCFICIINRPNNCHYDRILSAKIFFSPNRRCFRIEQKSIGLLKSTPVSTRRFCVRSYIIHLDVINTGKPKMIFAYEPPHSDSSTGSGEARNLLIRPPRNRCLSRRGSQTFIVAAYEHVEQ